MYEKKYRYKIYKSFQENILHSNDSNLMLDEEGNNLISVNMYDNINEFIKDFEESERKKKEKKKEKKKGLERFIKDEKS